MDYFILAGGRAGSKLLMDPPDGPGGISWTIGQAFDAPPPQPVPITVVRGYEAAPTPEFAVVPPVISHRLWQALQAAGVDNLEVYEGLLVDEDEQPIGETVLLYNLLGLVSAADPGATRHAPENPSRLLDASIDHLEVDSRRARGALMFRLAENTSVVLVHRQVMEALEAAGFEGLRFKPATGHLTL